MKKEVVPAGTTITPWPAVLPETVRFIAALFIVWSPNATALAICVPLPSSICIEPDDVIVGNALTVTGVGTFYNDVKFAGSSGATGLTWDKSTDEDPEFYKKYKVCIDKNLLFYTENKTILDPWLKTSREVKTWLGAVRKFEWQAGEENSDDGMHTLLWTSRGSGIRAKRPDYIPTLVAMSMIPVYGPESRKLTPKELLRLQSFPDTFEYIEKDIYKQLGNAVNVKMIKKCAQFLINDAPLFV